MKFRPPEKVGLTPRYDREMKLEFSNYVDLPTELWSPHDKGAAAHEGWGVGVLSRWMWSFGRPKPRKGRIPIIGRMGPTFVSHEDAHAWVVEQAKKCKDKTSLHKRGLAALAALNIIEAE